MKNKILASVSFILVLICLFSAFVSADVTVDVALVVSLVNQQPDPVSAGDIAEIRIGIENRGGEEAENIVVEIPSNYPFTPVDDQIIVIDTIDNYQSGYNIKIVKFLVKVDKDAMADSYPLDVLVYKAGERESAVTRVFDIAVKTKESAEVIHIDQTVIEPGKQNPLKFTINNVGNALLKDITFSWDNEEDVILPVGSDNTKYISSLDVGESAELQYEVIADTNSGSGLYKLNLYLTYYDSILGGEKEIATVAGVYVGGGTDFDVAFSESSDGETSFSIANIGSNPADSVSVMIPDQEGWRVSGSNSVIIGNLNKGDYTVASFTLQQSSVSARAFPSGVDKGSMTPEELAKLRETAQSSDNVLVRIAYTDTRGQRSFVDKEVKVQQAQGFNATSPIGAAGAYAFGGRTRVVQQQSFFSKYKWHILAVVLVLLVLAGYRKFKKLRIKNPDAGLIDIFNREKKK